MKGEWQYATHKQMKTELDMVKEGEFLRCYGSKYFIAIKEALGIGRVKIEMVPIGSAGKNGIVFYLPTEKFLLLCREITNGRFEKKIAADTGSYPGAYKYMTGEDGHLRFNIGGGNKGCRIQLQDNSKKLNYTMAVDVTELRSMAERFLLCTGLTVTAKDTYYNTMVREFLTNLEKRKQYHGHVDEKDLEEYHPDSKDDDSETQTERKEEETKSSNKKDTKVKIEPFILFVSSKKPKLAKGFLHYDAIIEDTKEEVVLLFSAAEVDKLAWYEKFVDACNAGGTKLKLSGERRDGFILYAGAYPKK